MSGAMQDACVAKRFPFALNHLPTFSTAFHSKTLDTLYTMKVYTNPRASGSRMVLLVNVGLGFAAVTFRDGMNGCPKSVPESIRPKLAASKWRI
jgi:hypothetical protein